LYISEVGKGICKKNPIFASGIKALSIEGTSIK